MFSKLIYIVGQKFRNPSLLTYYKFLKSSEKWTIEELRNYQFLKLKELLIFAITYSPFYRNLYANQKQFILDCTDSSILEMLPTITKENLLEFNAEIHTDSDLGKLFFCETSGSSGQVLTFKRNEYWDSANRAAIMRGYSWHGVKPWEKNLYFWGFNFSSWGRVKTRLFDILQNRFRLFDFSLSSLLKSSKGFKKLSFIHGYSSMIYELASLVNKSDLNLELPNLKMIKGTSEKIFPHYNEEIERAFGRKIISEYGAAEAGIIAFECPEGNMHLNMEGCYVEVNENSEILVTNLLSYSFPIIRYKLGDYIEMSSTNKKCSCGKAHSILKQITGRVGKKIYGFSKTYPSLTLYYIFKNMFFDRGIKLNYQVHQHKKGELDVYLIELLNDKEKQQLQQEFDKYFYEDIKVTFIKTDALHAHNEKLKDFISYFD